MNSFEQRAVRHLKDAEKMSSQQEAPLVWSLAFLCVAAIVWALLTIAVSIEVKQS